MGASSKECIACAEVIRSKALLCRYCGTLQDDPRFAQPIEEEKPLAVESESNETFLKPQLREHCESCNAAIYSDWNFCDQCGVSRRELGINGEMETPPLVPKIENEVGDCQEKPQPLEDSTPERFEEQISNPATCLECFLELESSWIFCENCGTDSRTSKKDDDKGELSNSKEETASENEDVFTGKQCTQCSQILGERHRFCENCGIELAETSASDETGKYLDVDKLEERSIPNQGVNLTPVFDFVEQTPAIGPVDLDGHKKALGYEAQQPEGAYKAQTIEEENELDNTDSSEARKSKPLIGSFLPVLILVAIASASALGLQSLSTLDQESQQATIDYGSQETDPDSGLGLPQDSDVAADPSEIDADKSEYLPPEITDDLDSSKSIESKSDEDPPESESSTNQDTQEAIQAPSEKEVGSQSESSNGDDTLTNDDRFLPPGWDYFPDTTTPAIAASAIDDITQWDNQYFFKASSAAKLRDSVTIGKNANGIGFCEPGSSPSLGSYSDFFSEVESQHLALCVNGRGTIFVFVTDAEWLASEYGQSYKGGPPYTPRMHWALGRPICSSSPYAMIALEDEGVPPAPIKKSGETWSESELWPQVLALPAWDYIQSALWIGPPGWVVDACGEDCYRFLFEATDPQNASCNLEREG